LFVLSGEASGDAYAAAVVERLRERDPELVVAAMGGSHLRDAGAEIEQDSEGLAVMGFLPVLARLPEFVALGRRLKALIRARRPKVVLSVDYPGFNLRLARGLADVRGDGTRFIHLVAPQVWAWRPRRAKRIAQSIDRLLCLFPFEPPLFTRHGGAADFVGHPLPDMIPTAIDTSALDAELGLNAGDRLLLVAPGSRVKEINGLLPVLGRAAEAAAPRMAAPGGRVVIAIAKAPELDRSLYRAYTDLPLVEGRYRELCARAHVGLIASGTATLEAAIIGLPHVIAYRTDAASAALARHLLNVEHIGLPNIVHGARVVPEVLQRELDVPRLVAHMERLWSGPARDDCVATLARTRAILGGGGAMDRIAGIMADELARGKRRVDTFTHLDRRRTAPG
ncbi:MAG: lipid-A-disaccharide synthase, partial [Planctomycetes bacterium]|nr:lipid-A-disaccharide synthase [Planctomycetota bacterium]